MLSTSLWKHNKSPRLPNKKVYRDQPAAAKSIDLAMEYIQERGRSFVIYKTMCEFVEWLQAAKMRAGR
jgi:hypothetical protein